MPAREDCPHFIPVQTPELVRLFAADPSLPEPLREPLAALAARVQQVYHRRLHRRLVALKAEYEPFDPDSDSPPLAPPSAQERQRRLNLLLSDFGWLLDRAHFRHLSRDDLEAVLEDASDWGIHMQVDFSRFDHCAIFARGEGYQTRVLRSWKTLFRDAEVEVPIFRRLVLILKLRPDPRLPRRVEADHVHLKVFKDIPRADVDMLLPGAKVRLKLFDRGRIGVGLISGLATMLWRMGQEAWEFVGHILAADPAAKMSVFWGLTAGALGYGYKSYYDVRTTRQAYHLNLTQSLYFQCLDSNAGVLTRLFDEAEEQETRTTLLAYFCLWRCAGPEGMTAEELEAAMGLYLDRFAGVTMLCEPGEPATKLLRLGLARQDGVRYHATPLADALAGLDGLPDDDPAAVGGRNVRPAPIPTRG
ncbi:MAG: TMEM143 family protein [Gemmataceae bacterium]